MQDECVTRQAARQLSEAVDPLPCFEVQASSQRSNSLLHFCPHPICCAKSILGE
jgi:hypothetical protein